MPSTRICSKCKKASLEPTGREMEIYNSVYNYECSNCGHQVQLVPKGSLGVQLSMGVLFGIVIWGIFMSNGRNSVSDWLIYFAVASVLPIMTLVQLWKHKRNRLIDNSGNHEHLDIAPSKAITRKPVLWLEGLGFLSGIIAPVLFIAAFLGIAALIGFVNFTFFGDKLFG